MNNVNRMTLKWIKFGIICGLIVSFIYSTLLPGYNQKTNIEDGIKRFVEWIKK